MNVLPEEEEEVVVVAGSRGVVQGGICSTA